MLPNIPKWKLQYIVIFDSKTKNLWIININIWELPPIVCILYIYVCDDDDIICILTHILILFIYEPIIHILSQINPINIWEILPLAMPGLRGWQQGWSRAARKEAVAGLLAAAIA